MADYEEIAYAVETIRAAHLFYEYGKLDRLLEIGVTHSEDDLFEIYYDLLAAATDYMDEKFNDDYEVNHWYFSFRSMMQYYRLIREYGSLHSMSGTEVSCGIIFLRVQRWYGLGLSDENQLQMVERRHGGNRLLFSWRV
mgnify:CR=1 FL=1